MNKRLEILIHIAIWIVIILLPLMFMNHGRGMSVSQFMLTTTVPLTFMAVFYIDYLWLTPRYFVTGHRTQFFVTNTFIVIFLGIALHLWMSLSHDMLGHNHREPPLILTIAFVIRDIVNLVIAAAIATLLHLALQWQTAEEARKEAELSNLRSQINPHFLLNTLNNIYALTAFDTEKAQNAIHQLSKLLRYTLYESDGTQVTLDKELQFIRSYINLMALRLSDNTRLTVSIHDGGTNGLEIAPMMFISLVENAFKHGVSAGSESFIDIRITLDGNRICCHVENSLFPKQESDKSGSGIGLANLQRQLELLYPESHDYSATAIGDRYVAELSITLNATKD